MTMLLESAASDSDTVKTKIELCCSVERTTYSQTLKLIREHEVAMNRCMRCSGKFGLIRHRWWEYEFCSLTCKEAHVAEIARTRDLLRSWSEGSKEDVGDGNLLQGSH